MGIYIQLISALEMIYATISLPALRIFTSYMSDIQEKQVISTL